MDSDKIDFSFLPEDLRWELAFSCILGKQISVKDITDRYNPTKVSSLEKELIVGLPRALKKEWITSIVDNDRIKCPVCNGTIDNGEDVVILTIATANSMETVVFHLACCPFDLPYKRKL